MKSTPELTCHAGELPSCCLICSTPQLHDNAIAGSAPELHSAGVSETLECFVSLSQPLPSLPLRIRRSVSPLRENDVNKAKKKKPQKTKPKKKTKKGEKW